MSAFARGTARAAIALAALSACGGDARPAPGAVLPGPDPAAPADAGPAHDGGDGIGAPAADVDEPEAPCDAASPTASTVLAAGAAAVGQLGVVGTRRFAVSADGDGLWLFDASGANVSPPLAPAPVFAVVGGVNLTVAGLHASGRIDVQRLDPRGAGAGDVVSVVAEEGAHGVAIGALGQGSLVVWSALDALRATALSPAGVPFAPVVDLDTGPARNASSIAVASRGSDALVVWSARPDVDSIPRAYAVVLGLDGRPRTPVRLVRRSDTPLRIVGCVGTADGYLVLLDDDARTLLVPLDGLGRPDGPARRFRGAARPYGIAAGRARALVLTRLEDGAIAARRTGSTGQPLDPAWSCLARPGSMVARGAAALAGEDGSFAVLHSAEDGSHALVRLP